MSVFQAVFQKSDSSWLSIVAWNKIYFLQILGKDFLEKMLFVKICLHYNHFVM